MPSPPFLKVILFITLGHFAPQAVSRPEIIVKNTQEFYTAVASANNAKDGLLILLENGQYSLNYRVILKQENTEIRSLSGQPDKVLLTGNGMRKSPDVEIMFDINASDITISGVTLSNVANHLIQVRAESNVDNFHLSNCVLKDAYEQLLKVSGGKNTKHPHSDNGHIENCIFEYSAGIGPQYYIGGIDAHRIRNWLIENNEFRNIASPAEHVAEHAIHIWNDSSDNKIIHNLIRNCDRGIGFGLGDGVKQNSGGIIANNRIYHNNANHPFADAGIILESSPGTQVLNNIIEMLHAYPNAIEYRFKATSGVLIEGNISNKRITARNGASGVVRNNKISQSVFE